MHTRRKPPGFHPGLIELALQAGIAGEGSNAMAVRAGAVTGGLTSPARLVTVGRSLETTSGVLNTVSSSQPRPPGTACCQKVKAIGRNAGKPACHRSSNTPSHARTFGVILAQGAYHNRSVLRTLLTASGNFPAIEIDSRNSILVGSV